MIVELRCEQCLEITEDGNVIEGAMRPIGVLTTAEDKTQSQEYKCDSCGYMVQVTINTLKDKL